MGDFIIGVNHTRSQTHAEFTSLSPLSPQERRYTFGKTKSLNFQGRSFSLDFGRHFYRIYNASSFMKVLNNDVLTI